LGCFVLLIRAFLGLGWLNLIYDLTWGWGKDLLVEQLSLDRTGYVANIGPCRSVYLSTFIIVLIRVFFSRVSKHSWTNRMVLVILLLRAGSGWLRIDMIDTASTSERDVIFDGLFLSMVTSDLIVAKMAGRELHSWVVLMATMVVMPHLQFMILCFVIFYYIAVFGDLMNHMNLPLLQVCRNVYCDGIYDLCHVGHKNAFRKALKLGNRLFVGVIGDVDANNYKRPPVMSAAEREAEVASCKCVTKTISNAPCFGLTEEFILKHRIHVVAFGEEYAERFPDPEDDPYYKVPRKMGIARALPRTAGLSTSELIKRIQSSGDLDKKSPT